jgi:hypothetical protein
MSLESTRDLSAIKPGATMPAFVSLTSGLLSSVATMDKASTANVGPLHPEYIKAMKRWRLCRDAVEGEDAVRARGTEYLPKPNGQDVDDYTMYSNRASYTNATGRAQDGLEGLIYRKKPTTTLPEKLAAIKADITTTGLSLDELAKEATHEVLITGRGGLLAEYPTVEPVANRTKADVEDNGERSYLTFYPTEDILNWSEGVIKNKKQLTSVKVREWIEKSVSVADAATAYQELIRVIRLNTNGLCEQLVYNEGIGHNPIILPIIINSKQLDYIPFWFIGTVDTSPKVRRPPVYDIAVKNIHHFQLSADRRNALHWADSPTPVIIGALVSKDGSPVEAVRLGSSTVLNLAQGGEAKYLEFQGNGLNPTKEQMNEDMSEMAILLSRILASDSKGAEAAETAAIHRAGENAVLAAIANAISTAFTKALTAIAEWEGVDIVKEEISYRLNTNFYPTPMTSQMLIALTNSLITGKGITPEEFYDALVAGDVVRPDKTFDQHKEELDKMPKPPEEPAGGALNAPKADVNGDGTGTKDPPGRGEVNVS